MTSALSPDGFITRMDNRMTADQPLSCNFVNRLVGNAMHLTDQLFQPRINWVELSGVANYGVLAEVAGTVRMASVIVPWTMRYDGTPAEPVLRVGGKVSAGTLTVRAGVGPANGPVDVEASTEGDVYWLYASASTTSATDVWIIDTHSSGVDDYDQLVEQYARDGQRYQTFRDDSGSDVLTTAIVYRARLDIWFEFSGGATGVLSGVYLREFSG